MNQYENFVNALLWAILLAICVGYVAVLPGCATLDQATQQGNKYIQQFADDTQLFCQDARDELESQSVALAPLAVYCTATGDVDSTLCGFIIQIKEKAETYKSYLKKYCEDTWNALKTYKAITDLLGD